MTTQQMINRLQYSRNELTASIARSIAEGYMTIKEAKQRNTDDFMAAVLNGEVDEAFCLADLSNQRCLAEEYSISEEQFLEL